MLATTIGLRGKATRIRRRELDPLVASAANASGAKGSFVISFVVSRSMPAGLGGLRHGAAAAPVLDRQSDPNPHADILLVALGKGSHGRAMRLAFPTRRSGTGGPGWAESDDGLRWRGRPWRWRR